MFVIPTISRKLPESEHIADSARVAPILRDYRAALSSRARISSARTGFIR